MNFIDKINKKNIFIRDNITLLNGNSEKYLSYLPDNYVDLILTDPPYNLGLFMKKRSTNLNAMRENHFSGKNWDNLDFENWKKNIDRFFKESSRILKNRGSLVIFMSILKVETIVKMAEKYGFYYKCTGIWHKKNPMPRNKDLHFINSTESWIYFTYKCKTSTFNNDGKTIHDFFETSLTSQKEKKYGSHPTQKPVPLLNHLIKLLSNKNEIVFDPFMGSGSTGVSCLELERKFIGIEIDKNYWSISKERIKNHEEKLI